MTIGRSTALPICQQCGVILTGGLSQCHFDDLAWDRTRRLTTSAKPQPNAEQMVTAQHRVTALRGLKAKSVKCDMQKLGSAWLNVRIGVCGAACVASEDNLLVGNSTAGRCTNHPGGPRRTSSNWPTNCTERGRHSTAPT